MEKQKNNNPLVTVVAISFNQENIVLETLNSIFQQDYRNIELIVSDDGSCDNTVAKIRAWLEEHGSRFSRTQLLISNTNHGICQNIKKGLSHAKGYWIKPIACDDILCFDAITKFVEKSLSENVELIFSQMTLFHGDGDAFEAVGNYINDERKISLLNSPLELYKVVLKENFLPAPSAFYTRQLLESVGGIDISFKHLDDWPLWLRMLPRLYRIGWIDKPLILYRVSDESVSQKKGSKPIGPLLYHDLQLLFEKVQRPRLNGCVLWDLRLKVLRSKLVFEKLGNNWYANKALMLLQLASPLTWKDNFLRFISILIRVRENALPMLRGFFYFGFEGLGKRVRVYGPIRMRIARSKVSIGYKVSIHEGVALCGQRATTDRIIIGKNCTLEQSSYIHAHGGSISIGDNAHIGVGCVLQGYGGIEVGRDTMLGPYVQVYTSNHRTTRPSVPRRFLGEKARTIKIGKNCWIGANCILLSGSRISDETVVPAGTVLGKDC